MNRKKEQTGAEDLNFFPGGVALVSKDAEEKILAVNDKLCAMYQCASKEEFLSFIGGTYHGMIRPNDYIPLAEMYARRSQDVEGAPWIYHVLMRTKEGHFRRIEVLLSSYEGSQFGSVWSLHIIQSRIREESLETDQLTGLIGRYHFYKRALAIGSEDIEQGVLGKHVPVYINLTNFKLYNANHGISTGDELLRKLAGCLRQHFPETLMAHLSADNFIMLPLRKQIEEKLTAFAEDFRSQNDDPSVTVKAGITLLENLSKENRQNLRQTFDTAKIAADSIKQDASRVYAIYTEEMGQRLAESAYVLRHFEKALKKGYIKVYYQPVVRTLTGKLCSVEALARWEDPERGMLRPDQFIPVLEKSRLIPKLDFYVIEHVAKLMRFQIENQRPLLPISVNLSRVDFDSLDPVDEVEKIVERYQLPRNLLHIEITETTLAMNGKKLKMQIQRFRKAGYECWLDDFGSGYSSLNVLQHFQFDEIKLDMSFQKHFNEESRKILKSLVLMAKNLGVHTLAEGVETKGQADFLTSIGCEKIQGYYYARPMPYEDAHRFCYEQGLVSEDATETMVMEKAGLVNVMTDLPVAVFYYDGKDKVGSLWENRVLRKSLASTANLNIRQRKNIELAKTPVLRQFKDLLDTAVSTGKEEVLTYVDNGQYMKVKIRILAGGPGMYTGRAELYNITFDSSFRNTHRLDKVSHYLLQVYDGFYLYHGSKDEVEVIGSLHAFGMTGKRISRRQWMVLQEYIHPEDQQRFLDWAAPRALYREARNSGRSLAVGMFRVRRDDGNYYWQEFDAIALGQAAEGDILFCIKDAPLERVKDRENVLQPFLKSFFGMDEVLPSGSSVVDPATVFLAVKNAREIKAFWKDTERRFIGASRAFLDYYGIHDEASILGKTDEDMGWHVDAEPYKKIEEKVLQKGISSYGALGKCIIRGRLHSIRASKVPLYRGNKIIGLMGYFEDLDKEERAFEKDLNLGLVDRETGLAGFRGIIMAALEYYGNFERKQEDFICVLFHIPKLNDVAKIYGNEIYEALLLKISRTFERLCTMGDVIGYLGNGKFMLFVKYKKEAQLDDRLLRLANKIHGIREIRGKSVTLYLQWAQANGSEAGNLNGLLKLLYDRLDEAEQQNYGQSIYVGDRIAFDRVAFDTSDQNVMMMRLDNNEILYINKAGLREMGLPDDYDYHGQTCHKLLCGRPDCPKALLRRDRFYTRTYHNRHCGKDFLIQHILVPWRGKNCHLEMATNLRRYMKDEIEKNSMLFREMAVNDAIEIGLRETDPSLGIQNMLARVGEILECEKACIIEERPNGTVCNTYEWCRADIPSTKAELQYVPREDVQFIYDSFNTDQIAIIEDVDEALRRYGRTKPHIPGLKSFISGHLIFAGRSIGYTEIVNPSERVLKEASPLLATLTRFLSILLHNRDNVERLNRMSYVDAMTGTNNRRAFLKYVMELPAGKHTAFIFGDMNGLKYINDHYGHKAGDKAIRMAANLMKEMVGRSNVFRMGGDEFLMVITDMNQEQADELIEQLKKRFQKCHLSMAFGAAIQTTPIMNVDTIITEADGEMYKDKKHPRK